ncbi:outer membrane lipid asymmetry maintenance protein MlaD [Rhodosalinus sediminis]|jgi:phospholipid/cholesterol/gamma-HCH transport system substrate-binding protein|uniref:outer membrane lipid asymmetry maintenance protein MlaD n=1 Tax=Rhodosalinus sediminis TaxID=1940533 RepID=UPI0023522FC5|nr:outer membrane lipid asymmetry maintenance protein MlaD [Rhodosalinus sediminis]
MSHSAGEIVLGAAVLAVAAGFVVYAGQVTGFGGERGGYPLTASFRSAEGVTVGTDVRLAGVKIGTVTDVALDTQTYRAETTFTLDQGVRIPDDSAAVVASEGLLGGNFVEISPGGSMSYFAPGEEIIDTQGAVSLTSLLVRFVSGEGEE